MLEKYIEIEDNKIWVFVKNPPVALSSLPEAKISRKPLDYPVLPCSNCGSTNTVGVGYRKTKGGQVPKRECLACGKVYTIKVGAAFNMRFPKEIIEYAIKSVGEGITVRKVADLIFQNYHVKVTGASVSNWSNRGRLPKSFPKNTMVNGGATVWTEPKPELFRENDGFDYRSKHPKIIGQSEIYRSETGKIVLRGLGKGCRGEVVLTSEKDIQKLLDYADNDFEFCIKSLIPAKQNILREYRRDIATTPQKRTSGMPASI